MSFETLRFGDSENQIEIQRHCDFETLKILIWKILVWKIPVQGIPVQIKTRVQIKTLFCRMTMSAAVVPNTVSKSSSSM